MNETSFFHKSTVLRRWDSFIFFLKISNLWKSSQNLLAHVLAFTENDAAYHARNSPMRKRLCYLKNLRHMVSTFWSLNGRFKLGIFHANQISMCLDPHLNKGWDWRRETGLSPPVKYFTDRSKAVLLLWIFYVFPVLCLLCLCARLIICALWSPAGRGLTSWLLFVVYNCEYVTFPLVSWVRCGTWLYRFLIFAPLLTFYRRTNWAPACVRTMILSK